MNIGPLTLASVTPIWTFTRGASGARAVGAALAGAAGAPGAAPAAPLEGAVRAGSRAAGAAHAVSSRARMTPGMQARPIVRTVALHSVRITRGGGACSTSSRKSAKMKPPLCSDHAWRRRGHTAAGALYALGAA